jgi:hypothetical protein
MPRKWVHYEEPAHHALCKTYTGKTFRPGPSSDKRTVNPVRLTQDEGQVTCARCAEVVAARRTLEGWKW